MSRASISRIRVVLALLLIVPGCRRAAPSSSAQLTVTPAGSPVGQSPDVLARAEISTAPVNDAYEALMRFRPELLSRRAPTVPADSDGGLPVVYVNGVKQGGTDVLRTIPARVVFEIRYLSATAASHQFGPFHPGGVLAVRTIP